MNDKKKNQQNANNQPSEGQGINNTPEETISEETTTYFSELTPSERVADPANLDLEDDENAASDPKKKERGREAA